MICLTFFNMPRILLFMVCSQDLPIFPSPRADKVARILSSLLQLLLTCFTNTFIPSFINSPQKSFKTQSQDQSKIEKRPQLKRCPPKKGAHLKRCIAEFFQSHSPHRSYYLRLFNIYQSVHCCLQQIIWICRTNTFSSNIFYTRSFNNCSYC